MDVFVEQLFRRKNRGSEQLIRGILIALCGLLAGMSILFSLQMFGGRFLLLGVIIAAGLCYLAYYASSMLNIEFEYILTNGTFDVDSVINMKKRKRLASFECKDIDEFGVYDSNKSYDCATKLMAANDDAENLYYFAIQSKDKGKLLLIVQPDEKMIEGLKKCLPRQLVYNVFGRY